MTIDKRGYAKHREIGRRSTDRRRVTRRPQMVDDAVVSAIP
ncbi:MULTISPECIES: hypothetical protein [unclassified Sphingomonas]|nr:MULTISPECIES: hypothetical protein [unclassified Sphingomonas]